MPARSMGAASVGWGNPIWKLEHERVVFVHNVALTYRNVYYRHDGWCVCVWIEVR